MFEKNVLAVDIGTSSVRAMVYDESGIVLAQAQNKYSINYPQPGFEEQNPEHLRDATLKTIGECLKKTRPEKIVCVSFSSQMYGVFAVDESSNSLCNNILWSDSRSIEEENYIKQAWDYELLYRTTGCPVNSIYCLSKLLWIKNHMPDVFERAFKFVCIKDYVIHTLTGKWITDYSMASATGYFDIVKHEWFSYPLEKLGLTENRLCKAIPGEVPVEFSNRKLRQFWGLNENVKIVLGAGDGPLANIGSGAGHVGGVNIDLGTSGAERVIINHPPMESSSGLWCYCLTEKLWAYGGILTNAGNAYSWVVENIAYYGYEGPVDIDKLTDLCNEVNPGSEGLFFLPYLRTPRSPYWDNHIKSLIYGLTPSHTVAHITKALFEALSYDLAIIFDSIKKHTEIEGPVFLTGGLSKSEGLAQLIANVFGHQVCVPGDTEGSIKGAAIFGFFSMGLFDELAFPSDIKVKTYNPIPNESQLYGALRKKYSLLVEKVKMIGMEL